MRDGMKKADSPELVASAIVKASTEANPHRRYTAGGVARQMSLLRRFVPASAFDKSLRKQMRLPAQNPHPSQPPLGLESGASCWPDPSGDLRAADTEAARRRRSQPRLWPDEELMSQEILASHGTRHLTPGD